MASNSAQLNGDNPTNGSDQEYSHGSRQSHAETTNAGFQRINIDAPQATQQGHVDIDPRRIHKLTTLGSSNVEPSAASSHSPSMPQDVFQHHVRNLIGLQTELMSQLFDLQLLFDTDRFPLSDADLEGRFDFFSQRLPSNDPYRVRRRRRVWFRRIYNGLESMVLGPYSREQVEIEVRMLLTRRFGRF